MNICIVDDDRYVVEKIAEGISWEQIGIEGVFTANTARKAREILETVAIHILLTDIEMPQGSGLELLEWIRDQGMTTECIFLSSYADFAYAQKAIQLHSTEYLLKPVSNRELEQILKKVAGKIGGQSKWGRETEEVWRDRQQFWSRAVSREEWDGCFPEGMGGSDREQTRYQLGMFWFYPRAVQKIPGDKEMTFLRLRNLLERVLGKQSWNLDALLRQEDSLYMVVLHQKEDVVESHICMEALRDLLQEAFQSVLCMYFVNPCSIQTLGKRSRELIQLQQEGIPGPDRMLWDEGHKPDITYYPPHFNQWEQEMERADDLMLVAASIGNYIDGLWEAERIHAAVFRNFWKDLQQMLYHYMGENDISITQLFDGEEFDYYADKAVASVADMKEFLKLMFKKLQAVHKAENSGQDVVEQIIRYIEQHLGEDLSRRRLASIAYLSEDYLSRKFMAFTGTGIPNFVAARRMEKARKYLKETSLSVSQIAMEVGYTNFSYFSKTFRDYIGCTPNAYRSRNNKNLIN